MCGADIRSPGSLHELANGILTRIGDMVKRRPLRVRPPLRLRQDESRARRECITAGRGALS
jgi:hypothetical protein